MRMEKRMIPYVTAAAAAAAASTAATLRSSTLYCAQLELQQGGVKMREWSGRL